jgi:hypothetical protein
MNIRRKTMKRKTIATIAILVVLLVSLFGAAAAQDETNPDDTTGGTETTTEEQAGAKFFTHPVVRLLSAYFDQEAEDEAVDEDPTDLEGGTDEGGTDEGGTDEDGTVEDGEGETTGESESGLGPVGEAIAAYHEEGMGFGVLVKIFAMVKESEDACDAAVSAAGDTTGDTGGSTGENGDTTGDGGCTPLVAQDLVDAFQSGTGMGQLFKEYGKPALLGVGHVKQALKDKDKDASEDTDVDDTDGEDGDTTEIEDGSGDTDVLDTAGNKIPKWKLNQMNLNKGKHDKNNQGKGKGPKK